MVSFKTLAAAAALSVAAVTSASAQLSEPAAYQAMHPDRDVLNGGALTPEAQMRAARSGAAPAYPDAYAAPLPVVPHLRRHHRR
jgi:hypothetical protein